MMNVNLIELLTEIGGNDLSYNVHMKNGKMYLVFDCGDSRSRVNISFGVNACFDGYENAIEIDPSELG